MKHNQNKVSLEKLYSQLLDIDTKMFGPVGKDQNYCRTKLSLLLEEGGELAGEIRSYFGRRYRPEKTATKENIACEIGDLLNLCFIFCEIFDLDIRDVLNTTIKKLTTRYDSISNNSQEPNN